MISKSNSCEPSRWPIQRSNYSGIRWINTIQGRATTLGIAGVVAAFLGLLAFIEYGNFVVRSTQAVLARDAVAAGRMALYADSLRLAQLLLALLAVCLGWAVARGGGKVLAKGLGMLALGLGVVVLLLLLFIA
jgi:hypothetical protein